jgi:hypothetical protein
VWEQGGVTGDLTVTLPSGMTAKQARPVSLRGEDLPGQNPCVLADGKFSFLLHAYAPASIVLE